MAGRTTWNAWLPPTDPEDSEVDEVSSAEMTELRRTITQLRHCVGALRTRYGEAAAIRRIANDVDRLDIDAGDLAEATPPRSVAASQVPAAERVPVPDTPYDPSLWDDADDEGVGGYQRKQR